MKNDLSWLLGFGQVFYFWTCIGNVPIATMIYNRINGEYFFFRNFFNGCFIPLETIHHLLRLFNFCSFYHGCRKILRALIYEFITVNQRVQLLSSVSKLLRSYHVFWWHLLELSKLLISRFLKKLDSLFFIHTPLPLHAFTICLLYLECGP